MAYTDILEAAAEKARLASERADQSSQILYDIANSDESTSVTTASGPVKSVAKAIKDISDTLYGAVLTPVREEVVATEGQTSLVLSSVSTAASSFYVNGLLRSDYTIDSASQITFDNPLSAGDQIVAIERQLDNNIENALQVAEDSALRAETAADDAQATLVDIEAVRNTVDGSVAQAEQYAQQAATATDDIRSYASSAETDITSARDNALTSILSSRDDAVVVVTGEGDTQVTRIGTVSDGYVSEITTLRDEIIAGQADAITEEGVVTIADNRIEVFRDNLGGFGDTYVEGNRNFAWDAVYPVGYMAFVLLSGSTGTRPPIPDQWCYMWVVATGDVRNERTIQFTCGMDSNEVWYRSHGTSAWRDWQNLATMTQVDNAIQSALDSLDTGVTGERLTFENGEFISATDDNTNEYSYTVNDSKGDIALAVGKDGTVYAGRIVATQYLTSEGDSLGSNNTTDNSVVSVSDVNLEPLVYDINHFIMYGQSQALGAVAGTLVSDSQRYNNIMFQGGIRQFEPTMGTDYYNSFVPLIETTYNQFTETPSSGLTDMIYKSVFDDYGVNVADNYQMLVSSPAIGSSTIADISEGSVYMNALVESISKAYGLSQQQGKTYDVPAVAILNGGTDQGEATPSVDYIQGIRNAATYITQQSNAVTGSVKENRYYLFQINNLNKYTTNYLDTDTNISQAQFDIAKEDGNISVVCPTYWGDFADNFHMLALSQRKLGAYIAVAYKKEVLHGEKFKPLRPIKTVTQGRIVLIEFDVPHGGLVFDVDQVNQVTNYGFGIGTQDANNVVTLDTQTIESVQIVGKSAVKIVCTGDVADNSVVTYAYNQTTGIGRSNGMRGNLRDEQGEVEYLSGYQTKLRLDNWCLSFIINANGYVE